jgi:high affinity Mn2+ porin
VSGRRTSGLLSRLGLASAAGVLIVSLSGPATAQATDAASASSAPENAQAADRAPRVGAIHAQATFVDQANAAFRSPYAGANSLPGQAEGRETSDVTLYIGVRPWQGAEIWVNPEMDQGFGLANTLGVAGFPSGEAYKVGKVDPYFRLQRLFLRQTISLSGETRTVDPDLNQLGMNERANRLVITVGKFAVTDVFDTNAYAHDPKHDFLNWTLIDAGVFDYAADAWGYTVGGAVEWYQGPWTVRGGAFDLSTVPNSETLDSNFGQFQLVGEIERRYAIGGRAGAVKLTGFLSRGNMGTFADAIALGEAQGQAPSTAAVRRYRSRGGVSVNLQQQLTSDLGFFARGGWADGNVEPYEFTDVDRTISVGLSLTGKRWGRSGDTLGLAGVINDATAIHQQYFAAGGLGILVGDGQLPHPGSEDILETYYDFAFGRFVHLAFDYQFVNNPAYNRDRGPVSLFAARLHAQF